MKNKTHLNMEEKSEWPQHGDGECQADSVEAIFSYWCRISPTSQQSHPVGVTDHME